MSTGKSVRLFLADGTPGGLLTAEIMNWTGHVIAAPRSDLATLLKRSETERTGVYILLGDDPESLGGQMAYIGEGDSVRKRLYNHSREEENNGKDFWDRAIVLTSKDANLTKAHVRYLESRFIELASVASRAKLKNSTSPPRISLPEADRSDMEYYIDQAKIILPVLGVNILRSAATQESLPANQDGSKPRMSPHFELWFEKENVRAVAQEVDGEFTVLEGSGARLTWVKTSTHSYRNLREKLEEESILVPSADGKSMVFAQSYVFSSPSAAAAIIKGRAANGRTEWIEQDSRITYGQWQQRAIDAAVGQENNQ